MTSNKRVRIFLKNNEALLNFMWADTSKDGSVMMGLQLSAFKGSVKTIFNGDEQLFPDKHFENVDSDTVLSNTKITFHKSGRYKLMQKIIKGGIDRVTVDGEPLESINKPTRMLEILIPTTLEIAKSCPRENKDAVIDITKFPYRPLRCTVICMPIKCMDEFNRGIKVKTSIVEQSCFFEYNDMAWAWTIRVSKEDKLAPERMFYIFLHGKVSFPK